MAEGALNGFRGSGRPAAFRTPSPIEIVDGVLADVLAGRAVVAVRGDAGVGKTTQMRVIASKLGMQQRTVVMASAASVSPRKLLRSIGEAVGLADTGSLAPDRLLETLQAHERNERLVVLFDDADALSPAMFRYLGLLIELFDRHPVKLQLVLFGPLGQWPGLQDPDLETMRQATFSRHIIYAPAPSDDASSEEGAVAAARSDPTSTRLRQSLSNPESKWSRRASIAALCLLFVAGATVTFLVNDAETPNPSPVRASGRQSLVPTQVVAPPAQPAEPEAPARPADVEEAITAPVPPPPATSAQTQTVIEKPARSEDYVPPARRGGPGLVLVAGAGDDLPNLYARVYRGLEPPPYVQVVAANRSPVKPGTLVVFPEPPAGWPSQ